MSFRSRSVVQCATLALLILTFGCGTDDAVGPFETSQDLLPGAVGLAGEVGTYNLAVGDTASILVSITRYQSLMQFRSSDTSAVTVSPNGVVTAVAPGTARVTAQFGWYIVVSTVNVAGIAAPELTSLALEPQSVTLAAGATQHFDVHATWSSGDTLLPPVAYSATAGAVSAQGDYTAPAAAGTYQVVASSANGVVQDTATVVVTATKTPGSGAGASTYQLDVGESVQFLVDISRYQSLMAWTSDDPSVAKVSSSGVITGVSAGAAVVTATFGWYRVVATVGVGGGSGPPAPPSLTELHVAPKSVTLNVGGTQQFSASALWSDGGTSTAGVAYLATGGTISSSGVYTAPAVAGTYRVVLTHSGGALKDTAVVTVSSSGTSGPPPSGVNVLFRDDFESGDFSTSSGGISWVKHRYALSTATVAASGARSMRLNLGASGSAGAELRFGGLPRLKEVYLQFYLFMPSGNESPTLGSRVRVPVDGKNDKFFRLWSGSYTTAVLKYGASTWGLDGVGRIGTEFNRNAGDRMLGMGQGGSYWMQNPKVPFVGDPAYLGRWVQIRIRCRVAGPQNDDGAIQIWLDGNLVISKVNLPSYPMGGAKNYFTDGYILGWANSGFAPGVNFYLDNVSISTGGFPS